MQEKWLYSIEKRARAQAAVATTAAFENVKSLGGVAYVCMYVRVKRSAEMQQEPIAEEEEEVRPRSCS